MRYVYTEAVAIICNMFTKEFRSLYAIYLRGTYFAQLAHALQ
ncbi:hypothetical protein GVAMD_0849 [Gardnerella vaginalis AMD]|nr:hypothetical protein GVAMD_0849 [Gardnerella vaginalis AMD]